MVWFGLVLWHIDHCWLFDANSFLYIYIEYLGFGFVGFLWCINYCWLFNATSSLYIYIKYIGFGLVRFYGASSIVVHLMPNTFHIYIKYIISKQILKNNFWNKPELLFLYTVKLFHLISNTSLLFTHSHLFKYSFFCLHTVKSKTVLFQTIQFSMSTKLNCSEYWYVSPKIQLKSSHLFAHG